MLSVMENHVQCMKKKVILILKNMQFSGKGRQSLIHKHYENPWKATLDWIIRSIRISTVVQNKCYLGLWPRVQHTLSSYPSMLMVFLSLSTWPSSFWIFSSSLATSFSASTIPLSIRWTSHVAPTVVMVQPLGTGSEVNRCTLHEQKMDQ